MRNLQIVRKYNTKPAYKSPLCFCAGDQSSLIVIDNSNNNDDAAGDINSSNGRGTRIVRVFPGKEDIQELHQFSEQELEMLHPVGKPNAIQMSYSRPNDTIYMATQAGGFYQFPIGSEEIEEMLIAPTGISTFAVSPDSRYLVIGTTDETLIVFSLPDLEMLATIELPQQQQKEGENQQQVDMTVCWRHDSRYFAVNYIFQGIRKLQVYDENGTLYSTTEDCNPIPIDSKCLAWQPSGGLLGTLGISPALNNSENITFFELNGLKRSDFNPFEGRMDSRDKSRVLDIHWNVNSDVIALRKENTVELWIRANYVWMCKKTIQYEEDGTENISFVAWDTELPYRLHTVFNNGQYYVRDLCFAYSTGLSAGSALTVSINGPQLYCTPFRDTGAPPPNCRFQVNVGSGLIQEIVISNFWDGFFTVLSTGELLFFKYYKKNNSLVKVATAQITSTSATEENEKEGKNVNLKACYNWIWLNKTQVSCISTNGTLLTFELSNTDFLLQENNNDTTTNNDAENVKESEVISSSNNNNVTLKLQSSLSVRGKLLLPIFNEKVQKASSSSSSGVVQNGEKINDDLQEKVETKYLLVQKRCGAILLQEVGVMPNILLGRLPDSVHELKYILITDPQEKESNEEYKISENSIIVLGLDPLTRTLHALYKNTSLKLMSDITSIEIFNELYLLATTTQGSLEVVHIKDLLQFLQSCGQKTQQQQQPNSIILEKINVPLSIATTTTPSQVNQLNSYSRKVEKGSIIVNCCWNRILEPSLTLQIIPRGNLEIISPRPLIISSMALLLERRKYNQVMIAMRRHRLDFNVLAQQLKDLSKTNNNNTLDDLLLRNQLCSILEDVQDSHTLVLMVTELSVEHLDVVKLMKAILEDKLLHNNNTSSINVNENDTKNKGLIQPYLAVMAKLNLYEDILRSPLIFGSGTPTDREIIKGRIKFLSFYCDNPEILYESALGTYDLGLTSLVADCLNKDPKEYLPILNEYKSYSEPKLKFTIDNKLKRYSKALVSLLRQQEYEQEQNKESTVKNAEIIKYIERHRIYQAGIKYLEEKETTTNDEEILLKQIYSAYGSYFEELRKLPEAAISYNRAQDYDRSFECYAKSGNWVQAIIIISQIQQNKLEDKEKINQLYLQLVNHLDHLKDYEAAAQVLDYHVQNKAEAFRYYVKAHNWTKANLMIDFLKNDIELLNKYKRELRDGVNNLDDNCNSVQEEIHRYTLRLSVIKKEKEDREANGGGFDQDNFSDTDSISTTSSIRSSSNSMTSSVHSGKSYKSRKNMRKEKRKLFSLKEGSRFEDIAIIVHLWELISKRVMNEIKPEVEAILPSLWVQRVDDGATKLISDFEALLQEADNCIKEVWPTILPQHENLEFKYCVPPPAFSTLWSKIIL